MCPTLFTCVWFYLENVKQLIKQEKEKEVFEKCIRILKIFKDVMIRMKIDEKQLRLSKWS